MTETTDTFVAKDYDDVLCLGLYSGFIYGISFVFLYILLERLGWTIGSWDEVSSLALGATFVLFMAVSGVMFAIAVEDLDNLNEK